MDWLAISWEKIVKLNDDDCCKLGIFLCRNLFLFKYLSVNNILQVDSWQGDRT